MGVIQVQNNESNQEEKRTCEYKGVTYFVMTDIENGKCFIEVGGERKYLNKCGKVANKQPGGRNVKDCVDSYDDMAKIYKHLLE